MVFWDCVAPFFQPVPKSPSGQSAEAELVLNKPPSGRSSNLRRATSTKDLISRFSGPDPFYLPKSGSGKLVKAFSIEVLDSPVDECPAPSLMPTPANKSQTEAAQKESKDTQSAVQIQAEKTEPKPKSKTQMAESGRESVADSGMGSVREQ